MRDWLAALSEALAREPRVVRVVVATVRGSAPREPGASMLVAPGELIGTIGGGHLELVATRIAREMLLPGAAGMRHDRFPLAASLGQCCGGIVELWFERYEAADASRLVEAMRLRDAGAPAEAIAAHASRDPRAVQYEQFDPRLTELWLFGAGHVGRALVHVLAPLPFRITWVDSREDAWEIGSRAIAAGAAPGMTGMGVTPGVAIAAMARGPITLHSPQPEEEVRHMPPAAWALVMTHSHDEDLAICEALLADGRFGWAGVIGSQAKTNRFRQRLARKFPAEAVARLTMPIGIGGIASKEPAAIAVAGAAQLLQLRESMAVRAGTTRSTGHP
jgi:xanthine dehydrogenase accessory factor